MDIETKSSLIVPKRQWSEEERRNHFQAWKQSGLSCRSYCQEHGLSNKTFSSWIKKFKAQTGSSMKFVSLPLKNEKIIEEQSVEIKLSNGILCRFPKVVSTASIKKLIQELQDVTAD
jgi:transposase-like protein